MVPWHRRKRVSEPIREIILEAMEASLEAQLSAIRKLRKKPELVAEVKTSKGKSQIGMVRDVLEEARQPLHLNVIIDRVQARFGVRLDPDSIGSALTKRVVKKELFIRPAKNTFALLESEDAG
jgi:hypothetical protein